MYLVTYEGELDHREGRCILSGRLTVEAPFPSLQAAAECPWVYSRPVNSWTAIHVDEDAGTWDGKLLYLGRVAGRVTVQRKES